MHDHGSVRSDSWLGESEPGCQLADRGPVAKDFIARGLAIGHHRINHSYRIPNALDRRVMSTPGERRRRHFSAGYGSDHWPRRNDDVGTDGGPPEARPEQWLGGWDRAVPLACQKQRKTAVKAREC